jgi:hypothetical protein
MYTNGTYYKMPIGKDITKTGKCQLCGKSLTDLRKIEEEYNQAVEAV